MGFGVGVGVGVGVAVGVGVGFPWPFLAAVTEITTCAVFVLCRPRESVTVSFAG